MRLVSSFPAAFFAGLSSISLLVAGSMLGSPMPTAAGAAVATGDPIVDVTQMPWGSPEPYGCLTSFYDESAATPQWRCNLNASGLPDADFAVTSSATSAVEVNVDWKDVEPCPNEQNWGPSTPRWQPSQTPANRWCLRFVFNREVASAPTRVPPGGSGPSPAPAE